MDTYQVNAGTTRLSPGRRRVLYIQPGTAVFAGIERVVDTVCAGLAERFSGEFEIDVLYTTGHDYRPPCPKYNVIEVRPRGRLQLMLMFRKVIKSKDYDLVVVPQIEPAVIAMASCLGLPRKFAIHLHGNPRREKSHLKARILFLLMRRYFLHRASYVFGTSSKQLASFQEMFPSKIPQKWLPNPVRRFEGADNGNRDPEHVTFVNVGRFSFQKGQDILLEAFAELVKQRPQARLKMVGHGIGDRDLRKQIQRLSIEAVVQVERHPIDPQPALAASDVYVSTSRWEGWSLAICEALRFGLPVISTDCEFGPSEILIEDRLGRLVSKTGGSSLVDAMIYYCDNLDAEKQHDHFRKDYVDRFSEEKIVKIHAEALLLASK
ncbi:alpha-mannosyltransferase [Rhizobium sp. Root708]|uniref:glycosyltransferase n=1 Tax=Rhizobium sp. Root708 TaxID=1736592 RepID=UPI0006F53610|nr:glycosyltransferase [Rhizobium sp. Root708]KRB49329.1 alpha-mannosyltransferase [Rhizobium sp. Root708]